MNNSLIQVRNVSLSYDNVDVLDNIDLTINEGEFVAIVGPSGCGKTTLLNLISGYEDPSSGSIKRNGELRMVYQEDGLFPWLTVNENIGLGIRKVKKNRDKDLQLQEAVALIGLEGFESHYPHQLSGGMRQRVELVRALTGESDILLMDEPFSALDYLTRLKLRNELVRLLEERPRTVILVTHDIEEAAQLADRIVLLSNRPAKIINEMRIALKKPRALTDPVVTGAVHDLLEQLNASNNGISESFEPDVDKKENV